MSKIDIDIINQEILFWLCRIKFLIWHNSLFSKGPVLRHFFHRHLKNFITFNKFNISTTFFLVRKKWWFNCFSNKLIISDITRAQIVKKYFSPFYKACYNSFFFLQIFWFLCKDVFPLKTFSLYILFWAYNLMISKIIRCLMDILNKIKRCKTWLKL